MNTFDSLIQKTFESMKSGIIVISNTGSIEIDGNTVQIPYNKKEYPGYSECDIHGISDVEFEKLLIPFPIHTF